MNDLLLLATLLGGQQHGYALKKLVGTMTGHRAMHNNLVYPLLKRFVAAGWVSRRKAEGQRGQTRAVYSLTAKGKAVLLARLEEFTEKDRSSGDAFRLRTGKETTQPGLVAPQGERRSFFAGWRTVRNATLP